MSDRSQAAIAFSYPIPNYGKNWLLCFSRTIQAQRIVAVRTIASAILGFDELLLHNVNREHQQFIQVFGEKVLPVLQTN